MKLEKKLFLLLIYRWSLQQGRELLYYESPLHGFPWFVQMRSKCGVTQLTNSRREGSIEGSHSYLPKAIHIYESQSFPQRQ